MDRFSSAMNPLKNSFIHDRSHLIDVHAFSVRNLAQHLPR
jgi:hypothetical protein